MIVYHTSDQQFTVPDVEHSRNALDFGKGFYVTRFREQAEKYAERYTKIGKDAFVHIFEYEPHSDLKMKLFAAYD